MKGTTFYVTHYVTGESLPPVGLNPILFMTAVTPRKATYFFRGLDERIRISGEDVEAGIKDGALRALPKPSKIETSEGVWIDAKRNVWIADYENPLHDKNKRKVYEVSKNGLQENQ